MDIRQSPTVFFLHVVKEFGKILNTYGFTNAAATAPPNPPAPPAPTPLPKPPPPRASCAAHPLKTQSAPPQIPPRPHPVQSKKLEDMRQHLRIAPVADIVRHRHSRRILRTQAVPYMRRGN